MTIARKSVFAGVVVSLGVLAACQSAGPGGPGTAPSGVEGSWMSSDGVAVSRFSGGVFTTIGDRHGNKLAEGSYIVAGNTVQINGTSVIRQSPISFNCLLASPSQLNCTSSAGQQFTLGSHAPDARHLAAFGRAVRAARPRMPLSAFLVTTVSACIGQTPMGTCAASMLQHCQRSGAKRHGSVQPGDQSMKKIAAIAAFSASALAMSASASFADYTLNILHINDWHSRIESNNKFESTCSAEEEGKGECIGGAARLVTAIDQERAEAAGPERRCCSTPATISRARCSTRPTRARPKPNS